MAAPLEVAEAIRPSPNQAPINEKRDFHFLDNLARAALFNVNRHFLTFNVMIVVVESLAKQISVANGAPYSVRGKRRVASMTVNIPSSVAEIKLNVVELKLDRLIDEMRFLRLHTIAFDTRLRGIEAYLKASEPSKRQPESKFTAWLAAATSATARTAVFAVGLATGATLLYLGT